MEAHATLVRETEKCYIVQVEGADKTFNWAKSVCKQMYDGVFILSGWLASAHAKWLREHGFEVPV